jgi:hypothetical protein
VKSGFTIRLADFFLWCAPWCCVMTMNYENQKMPEARLKDLEPEFEPLLDFVKVLAD